MKKIIALLLIVSIVSCKNSSEEERIPVEPDNGIGDGAGPPQVLSFSENIEEAHNKSAFKMKEAVSFDIQLNFGGSERLKAKLAMNTNSSGIRIEKNNGSTIIFDGSKVAMSPDSSATDGARFDIFTWQYFFAMPFKLTDPGTVWEESSQRKLDSLEYPSSKLTFKNDTGDSPDDWYVVYQDDESKLLKAAAYIVTFGTDKSKAEENPHAIVYSDYQTVENVSFATTWSFHNWNEESGLGDKIGEAKISNILFFQPEESYFQIPENSKEVKK